MNLEITLLRDGQPFAGPTMLVHDPVVGGPTTRQLAGAAPDTASLDVRVQLQNVSAPVRGWRYARAAVSINSWWSGFAPVSWYAHATAHPTLAVPFRFHDATYTLLVVEINGSKGHEQLEPAPPSSAHGSAPPVVWLAVTQAGAVHVAFSLPEANTVAQAAGGWVLAAPLLADYSRPRWIEPEPERAPAPPEPTPATLPADPGRQLEALGAPVVRPADLEAMEALEPRTVRPYVALAEMAGRAEPPPRGTSAVPDLDRGGWMHTCLLPGSDPAATDQEHCGACQLAAAKREARAADG